MESTTLIKAFALMEATAGSTAGRTLRDLSADVGASKPTVHRILNTLVSLGYMEKPLTGIYRQTPDARRLVSGTHQSALLEASKPILQQLFEKTGETVNLGVLRHDTVLYLHVLECMHPLRHVVSLETVDPFHSTALGRAIVAFLPDDQSEALLKNPTFEKRTPRTVSSTSELRRLLGTVRDQGFAVEEDETDLGVTCIGAPIIVRDRAVAAISMAAPTARVTAERRDTFVEEILLAAAKISAALENAFT